MLVTRQGLMVSPWAMIRSIQIVLGFLTGIKTTIRPIPDLDEIGRSAWAFPVVGALMGILLLVAHSLIGDHFPGAVRALLIVIVWVVVTGGLHLDGWTDCWDSLAASVPQERRREILKDSRLGAYGALGLVLLLALKVAAVADPEFPLAALVLAPVAGRAMMVIASYGSRHGETGMAAVFISGLDPRSVKWAWIIVLAVALPAGIIGFVAVGCAYLGAVGFKRFAESRLGMVNGDVIGAMCELSETVVLLVFCVRW
ncbi:MAG: adenosylcobinamide-GDP ribazoletransferase [Desulfomonilaceae bacterium]|nr:adenosylcobinamide-GDP ribazoletransferase [Desulfomonilaceae bacterium]